MNLARKSIHGVDEVREFLIESFKTIDWSDCKKKIRVDFHGDSINVLSWRLVVFLLKGANCKSCGKSGAYFAKETHVDTCKYHLNLYALKENGREVLMTKDHSVARSLGGGNFLENFEPMCHPCNVRKDSARVNLAFFSRTTLMGAAMMLTNGVASHTELANKKSM